MTLGERSLRSYNHCSL